MYTTRDKKSCAENSLETKKYGHPNYFPPQCALLSGVMKTRPKLVRKLYNRFEGAENELFIDLGKTHRHNFGLCHACCIIGP